MNHQLQSTIRYTLAVMIVCVASASCNGFQSSDSESTQVASIPNLIEALNSRSFAQREKATQDLIRAGRATLRPLARNLADATPEAVYRSRKIIQEIAKTGDETTFLRAAGILKLVLFGSFEGNLATMQNLERDWKKGRTLQAATALRDAGASITLMQEQQQMAGDFNRIQIVSYPTQMAPPTKIARPKKLSRAEFSKAIDKVLVGSIEQNRKLVFGEIPDTTTDPNRQLIQNQLREQQWINANNLINGNINNNPFGLLGNSAVIGRKWTGDDRLFAQLNEIENLTSITLESVEINEQKMRVLARMNSLEQLKINDCVMDLDSIDFKGLERVTHVAISHQPDAGSLLESLQDMNTLRGIEISDCEFEDIELQNVAKLKGLVQVFLTGIDIPAHTMVKMGTLKRLRFLNLKSCTFNVDAYQSLKRRRPNLQITTVARAFLGVRGPIDFGRQNGAECRISEVIAGSGADQAGVKVDDVITKINGHDIEVFDDLILYISQHDIGDSLEIEVRRGEEDLKLSAQLGNRDASIE